jgi:indolepyruvate ferredoxin oxidoreductase, alpha subunit
MEEQDNRLFTGTCSIPMLDVSDPQNSKDMVVAAFDLSEKYMFPMFVRTTSRVAHSKAPVKFGVVRKLEPKAALRKDINRFTRASPVWVKNQHKILNDRIEKVREEFEYSSLNSLEINPGSRFGIIAAGSPWGYLQDILDSRGLKASTLKLGTVQPLPLKTIRRLMETVDTILVLEELEPFIELQVKALSADLGRKVTVRGKLDGTLPRVGEYDNEIVEMALKSVTNIISEVEDISISALRSEAKVIAVGRSLPFCPGCPHRGLTPPLFKL